VAGHDLSLEDFKARVPLAGLIGRYVKLARRGREHVGLCPFHKEKSPSFNVVEEKGFYHCFGCGAHGTAIDFVMAVEGLGFAEALERIADLTGIPAPRRSGTARLEPSQRLYAANTAAAVWFQAQLTTPQGREAVGYLERRGLGREIVRRFELGYAPGGERAALRQALLAQGFTVEELLAAGLLAQREGGGGDAYDRFRHRIMFPIADERGRILGFGGRALGEARAKYLNSPETELFHKGELLYNLHRAAGAARAARAIVLAEGYMDVIALAEAGIAHAVAPLGTAVSERQLATLWRFAEAPVVCLDGDRAGLAAAMRAAERALPLMRGGQTLRFAILPDGEDPDSYLRRHGAPALVELLSKAHTLSQMIWRLEAQGRRFDTPEERAALTRRLRGLVRLAADPDLRASLDTQFRALVDELSPRWGWGQKGQKRPAVKGSGWEGVGAARLAAGISQQETRREARLLAPLLRHPEWLVGCEEEFAEIQFRDARLERLRQEIVALLADTANLDAATLQRHLLCYGFGPLLDQFAADLTQSSAPATELDDVAHRDSWRSMLAAIRHRAALHRERPTEDELRLGDERQINRWFHSLDHLLNRYGADDAESSDDSTDA
jgi:DNA primase